MRPSREDRPKPTESNLVPSSVDARPAHDLAPAWPSKFTMFTGFMLVTALLACILPSTVATGASSASTPATLLPPGLRLAEILSDPDVGKPEFIELWNTAAVPVDLTGWKLQDKLTAPSTYTFTAGTLQPNGRLVVWTGTNATDTPQGPKWKTSTVWNNAGDAATLLAPNGTLVDYVAYGTGTGSPPAGFTMPALSVPAHGRSQALADGAWGDATPSPGLAPGALGGSAIVTVANVPPRATLDGPDSVLAGRNVTLAATVSDANGVGDLAAWTLAPAGQTGATLRSGTGQPPATLVVEAPATPGAWTLVLLVSDKAGATTTAQATVLVQAAGGLNLDLPGGALAFPDLVPGATDVESLGGLELRNDGAATLVPHLDVSDFTGAGGVLPVAGNLWFGIRGLAANANTTQGAGLGNATSPAAQGTTWFPYEGPLTPMPALAPGQAMEVRLRIAAVPTPLAAGTYGTTFAVTQ